MNKDEYVIINKTKLLQKIEELTEKMLIDDLIDMGATHSIIIYLERVLSNSIELIPEIEKAFDASKITTGMNQRNQFAYKYKNSKDYISNLKLDI